MAKIFLNIYHNLHTMTNHHSLTSRATAFKNSLDLVKRSWLTKSPFQAKVGIMSDLKLLATILYRMPEPRRTNKGNIRHKLVDIIVITLCAIICRCDSFVAVEYLGHERNPISFWYRDSS
ncbi:MAG: transposase family protein [Bradymonadia bacterium]